MKSCLVRIAKVIIILVLSVPATTVVAGADSFAINNQIKITATVLPVRRIIVDTQDQIQQIISNTSDIAATSLVYRGVIRPENLIVATPKIVRQAATILNGKVIRPGVVYLYQQNLTVVQDKQVLFLLRVHN